MTLILSRTRNSDDQPKCADHTQRACFIVHAPLRTTRTSFPNTWTTRRPASFPACSRMRSASSRDSDMAKPEKKKTLQTKGDTGLHTDDVSTYLFRVPLFYPLSTEPYACPIPTRNTSFDGKMAHVWLATSWDFLLPFLSTNEAPAWRAATVGTKKPVSHPFKNLVGWPRGFHCESNMRLPEQFWVVFPIHSALERAC